MRKGSKVTWAWGSHTAEGKIKDVYEHEVARDIKGTHVKRNGTRENPAYLIEQEDGDLVLKLRSELHSLK